MKNTFTTILSISILLASAAIANAELVLFLDLSSDTMSLNTQNTVDVWVTAEGEDHTITSVAVQGFISSDSPFPINLSFFTPPDQTQQQDIIENPDYVFSDTTSADRWLVAPNIGTDSGFAEVLEGDEYLLGRFYFQSGSTSHAVNHFHTMSISATIDGQPVGPESVSANVNDPDFTAPPSVPEPTSLLMLLAFVVPAMLVRRR